MRNNNGIFWRTFSGYRELCIWVCVVHGTGETLDGGIWSGLGREWAACKPIGPNTLHYQLHRRSVGRWYDAPCFCTQRHRYVRQRCGFWFWRWSILGHTLDRNLLWVWWQTAPIDVNRWRLRNIGVHRYRRSTDVVLKNEGFQHKTPEPFFTPCAPITTARVYDIGSGHTGLIKH
jgi:hypothetical protein